MKKKLIFKYVLLLIPSYPFLFFLAWLSEIIYRRKIISYQLISWYEVFIVDFACMLIIYIIDYRRMLNKNAMALMKVYSQDQYNDFLNSKQYKELFTKIQEHNIELKINIYQIDNETNTTLDCIYYSFINIDVKLKSDIMNIKFDICIIPKKGKKIINKWREDNIFLKALERVQLALNNLKYD